VATPQNYEGNFPNSVNKKTEKKRKRRTYRISEVDNKVRCSGALNMDMACEIL